MRLLPEFLDALRLAEDARIDPAEIEASGGF
jgi:hypothetical protein